MWAELLRRECGTVDGSRRRWPSTVAYVLSSSDSMHTGTLRYGWVIIALLVAFGCASAPPETPRPTLAPYIPTPQDVVDRMLLVAGVTRDDVVYDLGSGDGRIVITAARTYGARGVGVEIDPERIGEARENARRAGVERLVHFRREDILQVDVSPATVVTLYLVSSANMKLRPLLTKQLRPGARIVSHAFGMGDWAPAATDRFTDSQGDLRTIYLWRADGQVRAQ